MKKECNKKRTKGNNTETQKWKQRNLKTVTKGFYITGPMKSQEKERQRERIRMVMTATPSAAV